MRKLTRDDTGVGFGTYTLGVAIFFITLLAFMCTLPSINYDVNDDYSTIGYPITRSYVERADVMSGRNAIILKDTGEDAIIINLNEEGIYQFYINGEYYDTTSVRFTVISIDRTDVFEIEESEFPGITTDSNTELTIKNLTTGLEETQKLNWLKAGA